jgi:replication initiation and membrane attachment protein DnaB
MRPRMKFANKGGKAMAEEDRYSIAEFARRYKVSEKELPAFCELMGVSQDTVLTREEFRAMLARFEDRSVVEAPSLETQEPGKEAKEEAVANTQKPGTREKKQPLSRWALERKLSRPTVAVLRNAMGWEDKTEITEPELEAALNKHLYDKE